MSRCFPASAAVEVGSRFSVAKEELPAAYRGSQRDGKGLVSMGKLTKLQGCHS